MAHFSAAEFVGAVILQAYTPRGICLATVKRFLVLRTWSATHWVVAVLGGLTTFLLLGLPTDVIDNPIFGRAIDETPWSMPVLVVTSLLSGLLIATYVDAPFARGSARAGSLGGLFAFFAIGCPVCNKLVLVALGTTGAMNFFAPVQPYLAVTGLVLLVWALVRRLGGVESCPLPGMVDVSRHR